MQTVQRLALPVGSAAALAAALATGVGVGVLAVLDRNPLHYAIAAGALLLASLGFRTRNRTWTHRYDLTVAAVFLSLQASAFDYGPLNPLNAVIVGVFALWVLDRLKHPLTPWRATVFANLLILFAAAAILSMIGSQSGELSGLFNLIPKLGLAFLLLDIMERRGTTRQALWALLGTSAVCAAIGIAQAISYYQWEIDWTMQDNKAFPYVYSSAFQMFLLRISGLARNPHAYAEPMMVASLLGVYLLGARAWPGRRAWLLLLLVTLLCVTALGLSMARAEWLGFGCALLAIPFIARPRWTPHWIGLAVPIVMIGVLSGVLVKALVPALSLLESQSGTVRAELVRVGAWVMISHPINGVGIQGFEDFSPPPERYPVHNSVLEAGVELGLPGLLLFVGSYLWVGGRLIRTLRATRDRGLQAELAALLVGFVAVVIEMQGQPFAYNAFGWIYLVIVESAVRAVERGAERRLAPLASSASASR